MNRFTQEQVDLHNLRVAHIAANGPESKFTPVEREVGKGALHDQIMDECDRLGWVCLHGSTAHRAMRTLGEFDFVILAENGLTLLVEGKAKNKKLSIKQLQLHAAAKRLGHRPVVVRSLEEFQHWAQTQLREVRGLAECQTDPTVASPDHCSDQLQPPLTAPAYDLAPSERPSP